MTNIQKENENVDSPMVSLSTAPIKDDIRNLQDYEELARTNDGRGKLLAMTALGVDGMGKRMDKVENRLGDVEARLGNVESAVSRKIPPRERSFAGRIDARNGNFKIILVIIGIVTGIIVGVYKIMTGG